MTTFSRSEIEEAFRHFMAVGESADWNAWADLHTEDGVWVEQGHGRRLELVEPCEHALHQGVR